MDRSKDLEYYAEKVPFPLPLSWHYSWFALFFSPHFPLVANMALGQLKVHEYLRAPMDCPHFILT